MADVIALLTPLPWQRLVFVAGLGQLALVAASLAIPRVLNWQDETAKLRQLTRQVFWTYAAYIWTTNLCFGLVSTVGPGWLLDGSPLAAAVTAFIAAYWAARIVIQFAYFDRTDVPSGIAIRLAEAALVGLFVFLTLVYAGAAIVNCCGGHS
jgi:type II secretory pathway pseudopilin PulG